MGAFFSFSDIRIFAQMIFHIYDHCLANQTHLHMKGCAPELVLKSNSTHGLFNSLEHSRGEIDRRVT